MPAWKDGDRARVTTRKVTEDDRKNNRYFDHMAGLTGEIQNVYADGVALRVDLESLDTVATKVHKTATERMRRRFAEDTSEEQKKGLSKDEMEFTPHYVVLVQQADLEKV